MAGMAQVTVPVHHKDLHCKVSQHLVHVDRRLQIFAGRQHPQGLDQPLPVRPVRVKLGVVKDVGVAVGVIANVPQGHVGVLRVQGAVVRLIERSVIRAEIPPGKGLLRLLDGQKQPPRLTVHRHPGVATQGRRYLHIVHHVVDQVRFEITVVLKGGVQGELVQAMVVAPVHIVVEFQLQTVPGQAVLLRQPEGVVPLGPQAHLVKLLPVDDRGAGDILLRRGVFEESRPVLHPQVHGVDPAIVKEAGGVPGRGAGGPEAQSLPEAEQTGEDQGQ